MSLLRYMASFIGSGMIDLSAYGWEGYALTEDLRIWSCKRKRLMNPTPLKEGYILLTLNRKGVYLHQVIARVFLGKCPERHEVNHIDGDTRNNHPLNLEYVTRSQNIKHIYNSECVPLSYRLRIRNNCREAQLGVSRKGGTARTEIRREASKKMWASPDYRKKVSAGISASWTDERKESYSRVAKGVPKPEGFSQKISDRNKLDWQDPEKRRKRCEAISRAMKEKNKLKGVSSK